MTKREYHIVSDIPAFGFDTRLLLVLWRGMLLSM